MHARNNIARANILNNTTIFRRIIINDFAVEKNTIVRAMQSSEERRGGEGGGSECAEINSLSRGKITRGPEKKVNTKSIRGESARRCAGSLRVNPRVASRFTPDAY